MRLKPIILLICLVFPLISQGQGDSPEAEDVFRVIEGKSDHQIRFKQDTAIRNLVLLHIARNKNNPGIEGYRIRIFSRLGTDARDRMQNVKADFYEKFPDIPVHAIYDSPYYKVYVGDFRSKTEAIKSLRKIKKEFPSAFIVEHKINFPELN